jgi:ATPase family associated with various cellular activities (AAA)
LDQGHRKGLAFARYLHIGGYEVKKQRGREQIRFPFSAWEKIHADQSKPAKRDDTLVEAWNLGQFTEANQSRKQTGDKWTILGSVALRPEEVCVLACRVARKGPQELSAKVPVESIGDWRSADRHEIEGVRGVRNLMQEYLQLKRPEKPIAFAVFGPPGSGKSFAVKEAAKAIGIEKDAQLTFNLSQFDSPNQLTGAFHQIRDLLLKGKIPLVFWDEFDTLCQGKPLGWLRYFLAPIQDGQFLDQGQVHPTGGGIYVFAGGTRSSFQQFGSDDAGADVDAKKPDFVSRLRGYIDVRGPNGYPNIVEDDLYMIRRAFLLNSLLERNAPQLKKSDGFAIRDQVLAALLRTTKYRHGARSLESLVIMSTQQGRNSFELSDLLPDELLGMHVDARDFNAFTRPDYKGVLRVGISGHMNLDPAAIPQIEKGIGEALTKIEEKFPHHYLTAFSPLSPGADRLVARKILEKTGARLIAVLPAPEQDYINDFGSEDSYDRDPLGAALRQELRHWLSERAIEVITLPPMPTRVEGYEQAGFYIAKHCDVLIAVWDGGPSRGRGGTQHVVEFALKNKKIVWQVWASRFEGDPPSPSDIGNKCGTIELREQ